MGAGEKRPSTTVFDPTLMDVSPAQGGFGGVCAGGGGSRAPAVDPAHSVSSCSRVEEQNNIPCGNICYRVVNRLHRSGGNGCELWLSSSATFCYKLPALLADMGKRAAMAKPAARAGRVSHALVPTPTARHPTKLHSTKQDNVVETAGRAGLMSAATVAAAAVNQAVSMTTLDAPDVGRILRGIAG